MFCLRAAAPVQPAVGCYCCCQALRARTPAAASSSSAPRVQAVPSRSRLLFPPHGEFGLSLARALPNRFRPFSIVSARCTSSGAPCRAIYLPVASSRQSLSYLIPRSVVRSNRILPHAV
ncbi:hypothetical protein BU26DRAFT_351092 [Trematosphaeria pertusa]|uniref:Uncharacterized protein n=1 Tax=Trematosphaeria pertusa TaxID=390896 RepID=A0A6A6IB46_9PLEO|nr:uncharacterized protein BU26DRAFT_351092 [Trematosphaeria pertusa]KAF2247636.1 hypothetical protein BU26DRAFT_351092 [Trematosphaeria pertusa]